SMAFAFLSMLGSLPLLAAEPLGHTSEVLRMSTCTCGAVDRHCRRDTLGFGVENVVSLSKRSTAGGSWPFSPGWTGNDRGSSSSSCGGGKGLGKARCHLT
ncbi:hypothetical protein Vretifemale_1706, partial [Volvox reticuliferus]